VYQRVLLKLQLRLERSMTSIAEATSRPSVMVFDLTMYDTKNCTSDEVRRGCLASLSSSNSSSSSGGGDPKQTAACCSGGSGSSSGGGNHSSHSSTETGVMTAGYRQPL
jgi:hypothetical protein